MRKGAEHGGWRGGKTTINGYPAIYTPDHPRAQGVGYVKEHILKAEKALGKPLPSKAEVHHFNMSRNSGPLIICENKKYHRLIHVRTKALEACGHASWRKCWICKQYDSPENLSILASNTRHKKCYSDYEYARTHRE